MKKSIIGWLITITIISLVIVGIGTGYSLLIGTVMLMMVFSYLLNKILIPWTSITISIVLGLTILWTLW